MPSARTVSVAVLTFRRPAAVVRCLESIRAALDVSDTTVVEVLVIDNDPDMSGARPVASLEWDRVRYVSEPEPGVATARNRALDSARGDVLVFIDDDERAGPGWPSGLLSIMAETGAALVGGPVRTVFTSPPDPIVRDSGVFDRAEVDDGAELTWLRSGNLAIDLAAIRKANLRFDPRFNTTGGEDSRFSIMAARAGLGLRWSATAIVYEDVDAGRANQAWAVRRAEHAMSSFVRASAPMTIRSTARIVVLALLRGTAGACLVAIGWALRDPSRRLSGRLSIARSIGALSGARQVVLPKQGDNPSSSHYGGG